MVCCEVVKAVLWNAQELYKAPSFQIIQAAKCLSKFAQLLPKLPPAVSYCEELYMHFQLEIPETSCEAVT